MARSRSGYVYIVLCAVIFSTMEVMLKTVHGVFAPMQITCLRFLVGGLLLIPFAVRSIKKKNASLTRSDIGFFALSGFLCVVIAMSLYQMSVTYTRASVVAVIFSCNPIFVTVFAHLFLREEIHRNHLIALALELLAVLIIIDPLHASLDPTGALLAKGRLLGIQFDTLFTDGLYERIGKDAVRYAGAIRRAMAENGYLPCFPSPTNQSFCIVSEQQRKELAERVDFSVWEQYDETHSIIRFATSWATREEDVNALCRILRECAAQEKVAS